MTDDRVSRRATELTDDERRAGTDDAEAQAAEILRESDERSEDSTKVEHRTSDEATAPPDVD